MVWGSIIAAGIGAAGSLIGGQQQNSANQRAARDQMAFQELMASTRYQRTMADMKAAGLNPMLAYQQGGGSTPTGATYNAVNVGKAAVEGGTSAMAISRNNAEIGRVRQAEKTGQQDEHLKARQADLAWQQDRLAQQQIYIQKENLQSAKAAAAMDRATERFYNTPTGRVVREAKIINDAVPGAGLIRLGAKAFGIATSRADGPRPKISKKRPKSKFKPRIPRSKKPDWAKAQGVGRY